MSYSTTVSFMGLLQPFMGSMQPFVSTYPPFWALDTYGLVQVAFIPSFMLKSLYWHLVRISWEVWHGSAFQFGSLAYYISALHFFASGLVDS